jgi:DMSO/TMAO reductase YedYZ molybdopterin-dependent catalytic subunit
VSKRERDVFELYAKDPDEADRILFGRVAHSDRRGFLKNAGLATMTALLGGVIPFHRFMPAGVIPVALAEEPFRIEGKDGLVVLNDRPVNAETPAHLLDDAVTPTARHFIRNNGLPPKSVDVDAWTLALDGEVERPFEMTIAELKDRFEVVTLHLQLECGGNGRAFFEPNARGNQWTVGAIGCSEWTGVRLADLLQAAGLKESAVYTAHYGADEHLSGDRSKRPISRGVPISKALSPYNLVAFAQNGGRMHAMNGYPLRLVIPGWPGSCSQKWLQRIQIRDQIHDGAKMTGTSYRVPRHPVAPGQDVPEDDLVIIESMPVKSLITFPQSGIEISAADPVTRVRGHAWAGDNKVASLDLSIDFGATWQRAELTEPVNDYAWQHFSADVRFPMAGYYEVWARATDDVGRAQPFAVAWNPKGYLNNSMHRIAVRVV